VKKQAAKERAGLPRRQVHLDFHTSPFIPDVGAEFDAEAFAEVFRRAHVDSVTLFAKCHHGMCYYPTSTGVSHPALGGRDLLGEQIEALHRVGIRAPIYTTVAWEEDVAAKHPEWRQLTRDGYFAGWSTSPDGVNRHPGIWKFLSLVHPDYQDLIEAHVREIADRYDRIDGFFFDILLHAPGADWSEPARKLRAKHGLEKNDARDHECFEALAHRLFARKFERIVHAVAPKASLYFNAAGEVRADARSGPRARYGSMTHFEIESLPSGSWGYHHFPRMARALSYWSKPWIGMTGRFQKMWGDFGGIKPQPALEYECFRSQALGGGNSVGDQLPPRGCPDPAAYSLIGPVYAQCEAAEPFYTASRGCPQLGVVTASNAGLDNHLAGQSDEGAVLLCEELHYDAQVLDGVTGWQRYDAVILPDSTVVTPELKTRLQAYWQGGGTLLLSYRAGFDVEGDWALDFLPLSIGGPVEAYPTYWRSNGQGPAFEGDRVCYSEGLRVKGGKGTQALVDRVMPYFHRTDITFSSHFQTPPMADASAYPAVIGGKGFVYFADPVFREYRKTGNITVKTLVADFLRDHAGMPLAGEGLPSTVQVYPRRRGKDLLLTLLHYVPVRKALDIDVIDERGAFGGEILRLDRPVRQALLFPDNRPLERVDEQSFRLPAVKGRLLISLPGYFQTPDPKA